MDSNQALFSDQEVKDIIDKDLLELMGAQNMPEEQKAELYQKMSDTVQNRVFARVDDALDEQGKQEFSRLLDEGDSNKINEFLQGKGIDVNKLLVEESLTYKMEMMSLFKKSKE